MSLESHPDHVSITEAHASDSMTEMLEEQTKSLPILLVSLAVHALLFLCLSFIDLSKEPEAKEKTVVTRVVPDELPTLEEPEKRPVDESKPLKTEEEEEIPDPVIKNSPEADHHESADDEPHEQDSGDPDLSQDKPFPVDGLPSLGVGAKSPFGGGNSGTGRLGGKEDLVKKGGGGDDTEGAVESGLKWLADHQSKNGSWSTSKFEQECARKGRWNDEPHAACGGHGDHEWSDPGNTGLALLAFLGAGNTHRSGEYKDVVKRSLQYLKGIQSPDGCFGPKEGHYMYNHAIAALAMAEAYAISGKSPLLKTSAQKGIDFLALAQNPGSGWRYSVRSNDNDTSVTAWCVMALKSAKVAGLDVPRECFTGALTFIDKMTDETYWKVGYRAKGSPCSRLPAVRDRFVATESMTAAGITSRVFLGAKKDDPAVRGGADLLLDQLPEWNDAKGTIDMYYWYYGTLAMFQVGGKPWEKWNQAMKTALVDTQSMSAGRKGSWDPIGPWGGAAGRVYATSLNVLSLEIYYRYARVFR